MPTVTGIATEFIQFTRASNATVTDSDGKVKWAPHNLLTNSESFDAAGWTKTNIVTTGSWVNTLAAPNGTTTADLLRPSTVSTTHHAISGNLSSNATVIYAVYAYAGGYTKFGIRESGSSGAYASFDLTGSGSVLASASAGSVTMSNPQITPIGGGWFRASVTFVVPSGISDQLGIWVLPDSYTTGDPAGTNWSGDGTKGIYVWGAHVYRSDLGGMQPNTSAYPMYNPTTPKNLLGYTEALSNAAWVALNGGASAPTKGTTSGTKPNGLIGTVDTLTIPAVAASQWSALYQNAGAAFANVPITFSVYARVASGSATIYLNVEDIGAGPSGGNFIASTAKTLDTTWQRISVTGTRTTTSGNSIVVIGFDTRCGAGQTNAAPIAVELWGAQLSDSASLDPYVPVYGAAVTSAAYYGPRRDFDGATLACKGLLVEEQRTNLVLQSAAFDTASWGKFSLNTTGTPQWVNAATAPDGTMTADKIIPSTTSTNFHAIQSAASITVANGVAHTWSVYAKADGYDWIAVVPYTNTVSYFTWFNVATGAVGTNAAGNTAHPPVAVGNGWYRLSVTRTTASTGSFFILYAANGDNQPTFAGDGTKGVLVWGAQLEIGASSAAAPFATSYIPTGAATATRNADVASMSTQAFPYSATEGTLVVAWELGQLSGSPAAVHLTDAAESNRIRINAHLSGINRSTITAAGSLVANIDTSTAATGITKYALGVKSADYAVYRNGSAGGTSTNAGFPSGCTELRIGRDGATGNFNGHIRQITYIPRRISNTELQTRTA